MRKYAKVYADLKNEIIAGHYPLNALLPSESQLQATYDASRDTIRKALSRLRTEGYIQSQKGKGSIVIDTQKYVFPVSGVVSYKELTTKEGVKTKTEVVTTGIVNFPVADFATLGVPLVAKPMRQLVRVRYLNDEADIVDIDYLDPEIVPRIPKRNAEDSLYDFLEREVGLSIAYAKKVITVEPANALDQKLLKLPSGGMVVIVRSATSLADTRQFQFTQSRHRPDRFRFEDFARRQVQP